MIANIQNLFKEKVFLLSFLLAILPISFIAGNTIINLNIILILLTAFTFYKLSIFKIEYFFLDKLIFAFFLLIIFSGIYNDINFYINNYEFSKWKGSFSTTIKSLAFSRFLIIYIVIRFLYENKKLNLKLFFVTCTLSSLFVSFDIFYQFAFGKDIFGYVSYGRKMSGPFGDELIAGGYLQRFSIFSFFLFPLFFEKLSKPKLIFITLFIFLITFTGIILSGNRMPLLLFCFLITLICLFEKYTRKFFITLVILFSLIFTIIFKTNDAVKQNFLSFKSQIYSIAEFFYDEEKKIDDATFYIKEFSTFYETWLMNKYIGGGIKNFRYNCNERPNISSDFVINKHMKKRMVCNMHPHNYYLEVLTETGLVGFFILISIFSVIIYLTLIRKYFLRKFLNKDYMITPFIFLFIAEIFPIKSTGSFFTTGNATYLFLILSLMVSIARKQKLIEK